MDFKTVDELYERLLPALKIKAKESNNQISERAIWDFLAKNVWTSSKDLILAQMVDDIFKCSLSDIKNNGGIL